MVYIKSSYRYNSIKLSTIFTKQAPSCVYPTFILRLSYVHLRDILRSSYAPLILKAPLLTSDFLPQTSDFRLLFPQISHSSLRAKKKIVPICGTHRSSFRNDYTFRQIIPLRSYHSPLELTSSYLLLLPHTLNSINRHNRQSNSYTPQAHAKAQTFCLST